MTIIPDHDIIRRCNFNLLIDPAIQEKVNYKGVSHGLVSYGYDLRICGTIEQSQIDVIGNGTFEKKTFENEIFIPHNGFILASTLETVKIPRNMQGMLFGKSTWLREGLDVRCSLIDPEFEGPITLEIKNDGGNIRIPVGSGIATIIFIKAESECTKSYKDVKGKYMNQATVTKAIRHDY